jgi:hypothetical protein
MVTKGDLNPGLLPRATLFFYLLPTVGALECGLRKAYLACLSFLCTPHHPTNITPCIALRPEEDAAYLDRQLCIWVPEDHSERKAAHTMRWARAESSEV